MRVIERKEEQQRKYTHSELGVGFHIRYIFYCLLPVRLWFGMYVACSVKLSNELWQIHVK